MAQAGSMSVTARDDGQDAQLASRLRYLRTVRGWSQRQLAARADLNPSTVSRIENGVRGITSITTLSRLALALGCATQDLIADDDGPHGAVEVGSGHTPSTPLLRSLIGTTLQHPPTAPVDPLSFALCQVDLVRERRRQCDFRAVTRLAPRALTSLHAYIHGPQRAMVAGPLVRLCYDGSAVLGYAGEVSTAWIMAHRCREAAEYTGDRAYRALGQLALTVVAVRQRADDRAVELAEDELRGPELPAAVAGLLHLHAAVAGGRAGVLSDRQIEAHLGGATRAAQAAPGTPTEPVIEAELVPQARFSLAVHRGDLRAAEHRLHDLGGRLCTEPEYLAAFLVDLALFHLLRGEHERSLDTLVRCEQVAAQYAHRSAEAANILAQLAVQTRTDAGRRRVAGIWHRYRHAEG
ncbi:helix-turn-helix domain-containing protein [Hamadaea tsunoensis]|uniref:helix-turn-helix domain-containing protein n=1 Tax=Hamadaea tsunoensis TaxID=53368 RepID=UPI0003F88C02|nr:helix-turn-helix transcriptional regulator [Hamadaea tsunoensis]